MASISYTFGQGTLAAANVAQQITSASVGMDFVLKNDDSSNAIYVGNSDAATGSNSFKVEPLGAISLGSLDHNSGDAPLNPSDYYVVGAASGYAYSFSFGRVNL